MRALWSLPKAAPALLRHLAAYVELAVLDVARAGREVSAILVITAIAAICFFFFVCLGCLAVIAYYWDTPYRLAAIGWLGGGFLLAAVVLLFIRASVSRARSPFLSDLRREWQEDRVLLERLLSADEE